MNKYRNYKWIVKEYKRGLKDKNKKLKQTKEKKVKTSSPHKESASYREFYEKVDTYNTIHVHRYGHTNLYIPTQKEYNRYHIFNAISTILCIIFLMSIISCIGLIVWGFFCAALTGDDVNDSFYFALVLINLGVFALSLTGFVNSVEQITEKVSNTFKVIRDQDNQSY